MAGSRSFKEYVSQRFDNEIVNSVASYVEEVGREDFDSLDLRLYRIHQIGEFEVAETKVLHVDAYDLPGSQIGFDIRVEAQIEVHEGDYHYDEVEWPQQWFVLRCTGDLEKDLNDFTVNGVEIYNSKDHYQQKLYDSLVPIINKPDYEEAAEGFLRRNYKKALVDVGYVDPMEVAKSMNLNVVIRSITEDCSIFGQVYFKDCDAELYDDKTKKTETVHIPARTILVDPQTYFLYNLGKVNNTIIHECVHWDFHKKAFELDRLCNNDVSMISCRVVGGVKGRDSSAVSQMERQANALTPRIQMPMRAFKIMASKRVKEYRERLGKFDLIDVIEPVIDALAVDFGVSRLAAKIRMVEAGYEEAVGTFNWIDDHYVATHRFKKGSLKDNQTFTIGAEDLARQLMSNRKLKEIISDGSYQYVDSHLVIASGKYLQTDEEGLTVLDMLAEVKESIINAYQLKTGLSRAKLSKLMESETWMAAHKAVELGFADGIFGKKNNQSFEEDEQEDDETKQENTPNEDEEEQKNATSFLFSLKTVNSNLLNKLTKKSDGHSVKEIFDRLDTIKKFT